MIEPFGMRDEVGESTAKHMDRGDKLSASVQEPGPTAADCVCIVGCLTFTVKPSRL